MIATTRLVAAGLVVALAALPTIADPVRSTALAARPSENVPELTGAVTQDAYQVFQKSAIAYAISKQKHSKFKLTPNESMNFWDLRKKLSEPIEKRRRDYREYLDKNPSLDSRKLWDEFIAREDQAIYALCRRHLDVGEHCEATIYAGWITGKELEKKTYREVYDVYIRSYENGLEACKMVEKAFVAMNWSCKSFDGKTTETIHLVSEGVRPQSPSIAANLYADRNKSTVWPSFPTIAFTYRLPGEPAGLWQNFLTFEIRHYDRTPGDRIVEGVNWMTSERRGFYGKILEAKGQTAALAAFADNLQVDASPGSISFTDWETTCFMSLTRTNDGMIYSIMRREFRKRCNPERNAAKGEDGNLVLAAFGGTQKSRASFAGEWDVYQYPTADKPPDKPNRVRIDVKDNEAIAWEFWTGSATEMGRGPLTEAGQVWNGKRQQGKLTIMTFEKVRLSADGDRFEGTWSGGAPHHFPFKGVRVKSVRPAKVAEVSLSSSAKQGEASLPPGGTLKVNVTLAGGTGYKLQLVTPDKNAAVLVGSPTITGPTSKLLGAPSVHHYEFRVADAAPRSFHIVFQLRRPGQTTGPDYEVTVQVIKQSTK